MVVEPRGSSYRDPRTGRPIRSGLRADIRGPNGSFREFVALFHDTDRSLGQNRMPYPTAVGGFTSISYSAKRLDDRASMFAPSKVFDAHVHGDPRHVVEAHRGDDVTLRVASPWAEQRHVFAVEGHRFPLEPDMDGSEQIFARNLLPGVSYDAPLVGGAGGDTGALGDFLFHDHRQPFLEAGLWGIVAVLDPRSNAVRNLELEGGRHPSGPGVGLLRRFSRRAELEHAAGLRGQARFGGDQRHTHRRRGENPAPLGEVIRAIAQHQQDLELESVVKVHTTAGIELVPGAERGVATYPLRTGTISSTGERVWFVISDTSDQEFAGDFGVLWSRVLDQMNPAAIEDASFEDGVWTFENDPGRVAWIDPADPTGPAVRGFPSPDYSPVKRITYKGREIIVNVPFVKWGDEPGQQLIVDPGGCDPRIRINKPSPFFHGNGPLGCAVLPNEADPAQRYKGGQVLSLDIEPGCESQLDTKQCASVSMKLHLATHRRDLFPYYTVFDASKAPAAEFMGVIYSQRLRFAGPPSHETFTTTGGGEKAVAHIMQFANGKFLQSGGPDRFQAGLTSYGAPTFNDYSPFWHINWLFYDCDQDGEFLLAEGNRELGLTPGPGQHPNFDPMGGDNVQFNPFGMDDDLVDCTDFAIAATGNPDGRIYVEELQLLKNLNLAFETQAPGGWLGTLDRPPPGNGTDLTAPLVVNCPTPVSVDLRDTDDRFGFP